MPISQREFDQEHADTLVECAKAVIASLRSFYEVLDKLGPTKSDFDTARLLLEMARKEIHEFEVKDEE